jgi:PAS domain S-box-containing protein
MTRSAEALPVHVAGIVPEILDNPALLAQIVAVSADAIFSEDLHGRITSWNAAAERLYGCSAEDMLGSSTTELLPAETATQLRSVHELALSGQRVERFDTRHLRFDGVHVPVSLTVSPLHGLDGEIAGLATSVKDVTERVEQTAALAKAHQELGKQYRALSRSNRDLERFAYVASHDLSEPLRVMTGFVQLLEQRYAGVLDDRGLGYVKHVVDGAARMRSLIDDLLEYSRFLRAERPGADVDLQAAAGHVLSALGDVDVEIGALPHVWADEASVHAVLSNLISNGLKFHEADGAPRVVVSAVRDGAMVELRVDDNGIGIEEEYREKVFGMFARLHVREDYPGTGIGLAIVQQVAENADGRAWVEESTLGGSRFCITLPAVPPPMVGAA